MADHFEVIHTDPETKAQMTVYKGEDDLQGTYVKSLEFVPGFAEEELTIVQVSEGRPVHQWTIANAYRELTQEKVEFPEDSMTIVDPSDFTTELEPTPGVAEQVPIEEPPAEVRAFGGPWEAKENINPYKHPATQCFDIKDTTGRLVARTTYDGTDPEGSQATAALISQAPVMAYILGEIGVHIKEKTHRTDEDAAIFSAIAKIMLRIEGEIPEVDQLEPEQRSMILDLIEAMADLLDYFQGLIRSGSIPVPDQDSFVERMRAVQAARENINTII